MEKFNSLPRHVAFIMDGNRRWAEQHGVPRLEGHRAGVKNIRPLLKYLGEQGIDIITLYAFSTENWNRSTEEVNGIMGILESVIGREARALHKNGARIRHIGRSDKVSPKLQKSILRAMKLTENNTGMIINFAFNYGGRAEILDAVQKIVAAGETIDEVDEEIFGKYLYTAGLPDVDLVVRTGGEIRTSNFLIWQAAYSEYYFTPVLWPDFNSIEMEKALHAFSQRERRFGKR